MPEPDWHNPDGETLKVFGDESADQTKSRVFAVAGVVGFELDWQAAEDEWVRRTRGEIFHATDCEHRKNFKLYEDLTQIIANSRLGAVGFALDLAAFRESFPDTPSDVGYYFCFPAVINWLVNNVALLHEKQIEFTFDRRKESEYNSRMIHNLLTNNPQWKKSVFAREEINFDSSKNPRVQMADLIARETMKSLDNHLSQRPERSSLQALYNKNFRPFWFDRSYCAGMRDWLNRMEGEHEVTKNYALWLRKNGLTDNMSNRIRYFGVEALEAKGL